MSSNDPIPTISRVLDDGRIVELVYDPKTRTTALAIAGVDGAIAVAPQLDLSTGERLIPYSGRNNLIATGCVLLPEHPETFADKTALLSEVRAYLRRYVDLSPAFEEIAAHYALYSWVYDAFNEAPYLRFRGDYGTGKTRALLTLGSICYKPFFASGASTVSPIFHVLDAFQGTLILDEADMRFSDATAALTKILNNGNMAGLPVLRTMSNRHKELDPRAFRVFGPKLIGMRERFSDEALESRFLTEETGLRTVRTDIPIQLPPELAKDALSLRNKLLSWRFHALSRVKIDPSRAALGVEARFNQTALPLLSLVDDVATRRLIHDALEREDIRVHQNRAGSLEAIMIRAVLAFFDTTSCEPASIAAIAVKFNHAVDDRPHRPASPKWVGWFLRTRLKLATVKSRGVFIIPESEQEKLMALAARYGVDGSASAHPTPPTVS